MTDIIHYSRFDSPFNPVFVAKTGKGVCLVDISNISEAEFLLILRRRFHKDAARDDKKLRHAVKELSDYLNGRRVNFKSLLDLSAGTGFQRKVWNKVSEIPYGELRTYKWVAREIGKPDACRAVGNAVGRNPVSPIVPCHRVIRSDGGLGGFSSGISLKKRLLRLEI